MSKVWSKMKGSLRAKDNLACTANQLASRRLDSQLPVYARQKVDRCTYIRKSLGSEPHHTGLSPFRIGLLRLFLGTTNERAGPPIATIGIFEAMANLLLNSPTCKRGGRRCAPGYDVREAACQVLWAGSYNRYYNG